MTSTNKKKKNSIPKEYFQQRFIKCCADMKVHCSIIFFYFEVQNIEKIEKQKPAETDGLLN